MPSVGCLKGWLAGLMWCTGLTFILALAWVNLYRLDTPRYTGLSNPPKQYRQVSPSSTVVCNISIQASMNDSISDQYSNLHAVLEIIAARIEESRQAISTTVNQDFPQVSAGQKWRTLAATSKGYFEQVDKLSDVTLMQFLTTLEELPQYTPSRFYHFLGNDCGLINKTSSGFETPCLGGAPMLRDDMGYMPLHLLKIGNPADVPSMQGDKYVVTHVHLVQNAIVTVNGDAFTKSVQLSPRHCLELKAVIRPNAKDNSSPIYGEVFSVSQYWGMGFYHFTIEDLPRLAPYILFLRRRPSIKIHVYTKNSFTVNFLQMLGFSAKRIVQGSVRARLLYLPAGSPCGRGTFLPTHALSLIMKEPLLHRSPPPKRDLIVLIQRSSKRWFHRHQEILNMLQKISRPYGASVQVFSDKSLPSQKATIELFYRAFLVVAPHGAGLSNLIFSQPGTVVVEGLCYEGNHRINLCYKSLTQLLGHRYFGTLRKDGCHLTTPDDIKPPVEFALQLFNSSKSIQ